MVQPMMSFLSVISIMGVILIENQCFSVNMLVISRKFIEIWEKIFTNTMLKDDQN